MVGVVVNKQHHNHSAGGGYELYAGDGDVGRYPIEQFYDDDLAWREEGFGEHPVLNPLGDPFHDEEPLECGLEEPEVCESCQ